jgi:hypothetical protein
MSRFKAAPPQRQEPTPAAARRQPLEVMLDIMARAVEAGDDKAAMEAAKNAAPYVHPRLSSAEVVHRNKFDTLTDDELRALIDQGRGLADGEVREPEPEPGAAVH